MVHALEEIRRLLVPGGALIDIHPVPHWLFLRAVHHETVLAEEPRAQTYIQDVLDAEQALTEAVQRGLFVVEQTGEFDFLTYASSVDELRAHWNQINAYEESADDEATLIEKERQYARFHAILRAAGEGAQIVDCERARITRMRPV